MGITADAKKLTQALNTAGVKPTTYQPLTQALNTAETAHALLNKAYNTPDPYTTATPDNLNKAAHAWQQRAHHIEALEHYVTNQDNYLHTAVKQWVSNPNNLNNILNDIRPTWAKANQALDQLEAQYGDRDPDPATVLAHADAKGLKAYKERTQHQQTITNITKLAEIILGKTSNEAHFINLHDALFSGGRKTHAPNAPTRAIAWITNNNNEIDTLENITKKLNTYFANVEQNMHDEDRKYTTPKPRFNPKYTISPRYKDTATYNLDGTPTNPDWLTTHEEFHNDTA
ncbi:hypothetical protein [Corynebacterium pseudopelargi]|uniref:Uncharacterized protein n=1 Tax=Corynebacterium pseudopelargi TaxID=2080757 RepID=A0A3G6ISM0_9CORY|nr:hypothetical protein [Corynebacterium pseudopelargi]AZA08497.1 hypothetical protein CPPEL_01755 [Corynebacterium pseudopelargi]